jgi:uncharacterized protein
MSQDPSRPGGNAKTMMGWVSPGQTPGAPPQWGTQPQAPPQAQPPQAQPWTPPQAPPYPAPQPYAQAQPYSAQAYPPAPAYPQAPPSAPPPQAAYPQPQPYAAPQPQPYAAPQPWSQPQPQPYAAPQPQPWSQPPAQPYAAPQPQPWSPPVQAPRVAVPPMPVWGQEPAAQAARPIAGADATAGVSERVRFIRLTYLHLFGAILAFAGLEYLLMTNETIFAKVSVPILEYSLGSRYNWLGVLAIFMAVSWVADYFARHATSKALQYLGLGLYVIAEALIFLPLLFLAELHAAEYLARTGQEAHVIRDAAFLTLAIFGALTATVMFTKKDFSYLRGALAIASGAALVIIVVSILFGFNLGILFSVAMVLLAAGYVLYYTSQVLAHYHPQQYVAAALTLFSSIALMFWYVIRILMRLRS